MNSTIWKFRIEMTSDFPIEIPPGYKILHVGVQHDYPFFWAEVDPTVHGQRIHFAVVGTGHDMPVEGTHLGTWVADPFVWHLYQREAGPED